MLVSAQSSVMPLVEPVAVSPVGLAGATLSAVVRLALAIAGADSFSELSTAVTR